MILQNIYDAFMMAFFEVCPVVTGLFVPVFLTCFLPLGAIGITFYALGNVSYKGGYKK